PGQAGEEEDEQQAGEYAGADDGFAAVDKGAERRRGFSQQAGTEGRVCGAARRRPVLRRPAFRGCGAAHAAPPACPGRWGCRRSSTGGGVAFFFDARRLSISTKTE